MFLKDKLCLTAIVIETGLRSRENTEENKDFKSFEPCKQVDSL